MSQALDYSVGILMIVLIPYEAGFREVIWSQWNKLGLHLHGSGENVVEGYLNL